jgi:hypothetical protein
MFQIAGATEEDRRAVQKGQARLLPRNMLSFFSCPSVLIQQIFRRPRYMKSGICTCSPRKRCHPGLLFCLGGANSASRLDKIHQKAVMSKEEGHTQPTASPSICCLHAANSDTRSMPSKYYIRAVLTLHFHVFCHRLHEDSQIISDRPCQTSIARVLTPAMDLA